MQRRAFEWLADEGLVDRAAAEAAMPEDSELPELPVPFDPLAIARAVTEEFEASMGVG